MSNRKGKGQIANRTEIANFFGVSMPTVDYWVQGGCPVVQRGGKGKSWQFNTAEISAWREEQIRAQGAQSGDEQDERQLKRRQQLAATKRTELALAKECGLVAPIEQFQRGLANLFAEVKAGMRNIPSRVAPTLIGENDERRIRAVVLAEVDLVLEALANADLLDEEELDLMEPDEDDEGELD
ncbi:hypothetical protein [Terasakiella sp.]|uniref:hypothetical protein n=1 Tax=Terasakiella sp. TaxID=2034861 RepID=UPI003AA955A3